MKNKKCPNRSHCWDYKSGNCENCDLGDHITKLHKKIDRLKAKNKKLKAQSEWISVTERLPESGARVLGYSEIVGDVRCYDICKGRCDNTLQWWSETGWATLQDLLVTHWMPLPEPPEMKGGAE